MAAPTRIALLSTSDTDLLSARASGAGYVWGNPARSTDADLSLPAPSVPLRSGGNLIEPVSWQEGSPEIRTENGSRLSSR
jgi:hypothetical protein